MSLAIGLLVLLLVGVVWAAEAAAVRTISGLYRRTPVWFSRTSAALT